MQKIILLLAHVYLVVGGNNPYAHYPAVPKTASINGFADPIFADLPEPAQECVKLDTGITPCPYWDTGCFCVMANWSGIVGQCIAENCVGEDVEKATSLALSLCDRVGASTWIMPKSVSEMLSVARDKVQTNEGGSGTDASSESKATSISSNIDSSMSMTVTAPPETMSTSAASGNASSVSKTSTMLKEKVPAANGAKVVAIPGILGVLAFLL